MADTNNLDAYVSAGIGIVVIIAIIPTLPYLETGLPLFVGAVVFIACKVVVFLVTLLAALFFGR